MNEKLQNNESGENNNDLHEVRIHYGDYEGVAQVINDDERGGYRWRISILARYTRQLICYWDSTEITGDGPIVVSVDDIKRAQNEIAEAIQSLTWESYK